MVFFFFSYEFFNLSQTVVFTRDRYYLVGFAHNAEILFANYRNRPAVRSPVHFEIETNAA